jgi:hypothetical protein
LSPKYAVIATPFPPSIALASKSVSGSAWGCPKILPLQPLKKRQKIKKDKTKMFRLENARGGNCCFYFCY